MVINKAAALSILKKLPQRPKLNGLELRFQRELQKHLSKSYQSASIADAGLTSRCHGTKGKRAKIDLFSNSSGVGIELKVVCNFPDQPLAPSKSMHDVGQILSDAIDLILAKRKKMKAAYIIVLSVSKTPQSKLKQILHNKFYVDFKTSQYFENLSNDPDKKKLRTIQRRFLRRLNLDKPYAKGNSFFDSIYSSGNLAICIKQVKHL